MAVVFDLERVARESELPGDVVERILEEEREEFPDDDLMFELHVVRALNAELRRRLETPVWRSRLREQTEKVWASRGIRRELDSSGAYTRPAGHPAESGT